MDSIAKSEFARVHMLVSSASLEIDGAVSGFWG